MENEEIKKTTRKPKPKKIEQEEVLEYNPLEGIEANVAEEIVGSEPKNIETSEEVAMEQIVKEKSKEQELIDIAHQIQQKVAEIRTMSDREIYESYVSEGRPYLIYYQNRLVFDSTISDKKGLRFLEEGFQIHGRIYNYTGIRFKFKK